MTTLTDGKGAAHAEYVASELAPGNVRRSALNCIVIGDTAEFLRILAAERLAGLESVWLAWAAEVDLLNAHGFTGETPREAAKIALAAGGTAAMYRNPRASAERPEEDRTWIRTVADEMDVLTAEGFDPEVYFKEIDTALGGPR